MSQVRACTVNIQTSQHRNCTSADPRDSHTLIGPTVNSNVNLYIYLVMSGHLASYMHKTVFANSIAQSIHQNPMKKCQGKETVPRNKKGWDRQPTDRVANGAREVLAPVLSRNAGLRHLQGPKADRVTG